MPEEPKKEDPAPSTTEDPSIKDQNKLLIATGIIASVAAYILIKNANPPIKWFNILPNTPDPYSLTGDINGILVAIILGYSAYVGSLALVYSLDAFGVLKKETRQKLERRFRNGSNALFFVSTLLLVVLYLLVGGRIVGL